jgi:hypothetical protein
MPYFIKYVSGLGRMSLHQMSAAEAKYETARECDAGTGVYYKRVSGAEAHAWVRRGEVHSTPLYLDEGRIRYARSPE